MGFMRDDNMTEPLPFYSAGVDTDKDREPWRCPGCWECIGFIYRHPRRLVIDTDNVLFVVRGDAEIRHHCGAVMHWLLKREKHGILEELETTQEIVEVDDG